MIHSGMLTFCSGFFSQNKQDQNVKFSIMSWESSFTSVMTFYALITRGHQSLAKDHFFFLHLKLCCSFVSDTLQPHGLYYSMPGSCPWGFSRQEYWSGLPFPTPGDLPDPGIEPASPVSPALASRFFTTESPGNTLSKVFVVVLLLSPTLCDPMDCSRAGSSNLHYLLEFAWIHVHWVGDADISTSVSTFCFCIQSTSIRVFFNEVGSSH